MKITSYTNFRTNVEIDGKHYSLNQTDDYDGCAFLQCKEDGKTWSFGYRRYNDVISPFLISNKHGATYKQRYNLDKLERFIREIISDVKYQDTDTYKEEAELKRQREIKYHLECLEKLGYDFKR